MTRERYESLPLATLKELAKARNMKGVSTLKKSALIDEMLKLDETEKQMQANEKAKEEVRQEMKEKKEESDIEQLDSGKTAKGIFELHQDGYGFIRSVTDQAIWTEDRRYPDRKYKDQDAGGEVQCPFVCIYDQRTSTGRSNEKKKF